MPDYKHIYAHQAEQYQRLVDYEDYQGKLLEAIQAILPLAGKDVIETGAGTGRLTCLLRPLVRSLRSFDISAHMLGVARQRLDHPGSPPPPLAVADHRSLPVADGFADLLIAGWSVCYVYLDSGAGWRAALERTLADFRRILRPGGRMIIIETLGTGYEQPVRYPSLGEYLEFLDQAGFEMAWVRTDFRFEGAASARELVPFFFGEAMLEKMKDNILPECTGLWWQER